MMRPPTMAPGTDSKPPRMSTGSALSAMSERLNCTPLLAPHISPATIATTPATDQTTIQIVLSGMPIESAASWSSATARSARPHRARWKNTASTVTSTAAVIAAVSSSWLICTPRTMNDRSGIPMSSFLTLAPHTISPKPSRKKLRPIVAMNKMMCAWLTSGRSTSRSIAKASATMTAVVSASATTTGAPRSSNPTRVSAANSTITPWAKLNTPEALKMSTKPSATSEYISPAKTPPISTSTRNAGAPAMSLNGATATAYSRSSTRLARFRAPALPAQSCPGGGSEGAAEAPSDGRAPALPAQSCPGGGSEGAAEAPSDGQAPALPAQSCPGGGSEGAAEAPSDGQAPALPAQSCPGGGSEGAAEAPSDGRAPALPAQSCPGGGSEGAAEAPSDGQAPALPAQSCPGGGSEGAAEAPSDGQAPALPAQSCPGGGSEGAAEAPS